MVFGLFPYNTHFLSYENIFSIVIYSTVHLRFETGLRENRQQAVLYTSLLGLDTYNKLLNAGVSRLQV